MGLRNHRIVNITNWFGLQTFASSENLKPGWWIDVENVIASNDGAAAVLRSPLNFNPVTGNSTPVVTAFNFDSYLGSVIFYEKDAAVLSTDGTTNTNWTLGSQDKATWLTVNNRAYRLQGGHDTFLTFDLTTPGTSFYENGISKPAAAPVISYVAGGSGDYLVGVNASYAYHNTVTGHVGRPSDASNTLGATGANHKIRIPTVASVQIGVDKIVIFLTTDGGSTRYLLIDANGDLVTYTNATGNIDIDISTIFLDNNTYEPTNNYQLIEVVVADFPHFMFSYKNRVCLCDFRGSAARRSLVQYNAHEVVPIGVSQESWPPQNAIYAPNKADAVRGGIETPIGALLLGELDSYLIRGDLTDKISSPNNTASITESIQAMGWSIGTRSPHTARWTPFGTLWVDQNKRLQLWDYTTFPMEAGLPIRDQLGTFADDLESRFHMDGVWYQHGKDGGIYLVTGAVTAVDSGPNRIPAAYILFPSYVTTGPLSSQAVTLNGVNQYVTATATPLDVADVFTAEAWINCSSFAGTPRIFSKGDDGFGLGLGTSGELRLVKEDVATIVDSNVNVTVSTWTHVAVTKTGSTVKLYINGVDRTGTVTNQTCVTNTGALYIGKKYPVVGEAVADRLQFPGSISRAALYSTALSAARIAAHYAAATSAAYSAAVLVDSPVGFWMLDEIPTRQFGLTIYRNPEDNQLRFAPTKLNTGASSFVVGNVGGRRRLFQGSPGRLTEILDLDVAGSGWGSESRLFTTTFGNEEDFCYYHSIRFDISDTTGLTVTCADMDGSNSATLTPFQDVGHGSAQYAVIDQYGFRKKLTFSFSTSDTTKRQVENLRVNFSPTARVL